jgi:hypothetical protein
MDCLVFTMDFFPTHAHTTGSCDAHNRELGCIKVRLTRVFGSFWQFLAITDKPEFPPLRFPTKSVPTARKREQEKEENDGLD